MTIKKTLASLLIGASLLLPISKANAQTFSGQVIDNVCKTNPAIKIDQKTGIEHIVYSTGNNLLYVNSSDNFVNKTIIASGLTNYSNPTIDIDSNGVIHTGFNAYYGSSYWGTYYENSTNWTPQKLDMGNNQEGISLVANNGTVYFAGQKEINNGEEMNIILASSNDFTNFDYQTINKLGHQLNPVLAKNDNSVGLIYWDWSDGVQNGSGQYKTRFRSSLDNFVSEQTISTANQSYGGDLVGTNDNFWVAFKDSTYNTNPDTTFDNGDVFLADMNSNWDKTRLTPSSVDWMQDRQVSLAIFDDGTRATSWSQLSSIRGLDLMYASVSNSEVLSILDNGTRVGLGWVSVDSFNNQPIISANLDGLKNYTVTPEPSTLALLAMGGLAGAGVYALSRRRKNKINSSTSP